MMNQIESDVSGTVTEICIDDVVAWGGETEPIPQFGKVYISVKPTAAPFLTPLQKAEVLGLLESKKMVGITPVIVDPEYTYIYFEIFFRTSR